MNPDGSREYQPRSSRVWSLEAGASICAIPASQPKCASGLRGTILRPSAFMQNFLWFKDPIARGFLPQVAGKGHTRRCTASRTFIPFIAGVSPKAGRSSRDP